MARVHSELTQSASTFGNAFRYTLWHLRRHGLWRQVPVAAGVMIASVLDGFSIASLFPILTLISGNATKVPNRVEQAVLDVLNALHVPVSLGWMVLVLIVIAVLRGAIVLNVTRYVGYLVADIATEMRSLMLDALMRARWSYYTVNPVGRFAAMIINEAKWGSYIYQASLNLLIAATQGLVFFLVVLAVDWQIALIGAVMAVVVGIAMRTVIRRSRNFSRQIQATGNAIVSDLNDVVVGFKPMKAMFRHEALMGELKNETKSLRHAMREMVLLEQLSRNLPELLSLTMLVAGAYAAISLLNVPLVDLIVSGILLLGMARSAGKVQKAIRDSAMVEVGFWAFMRTLRETEAAGETFKGRQMPSLAQACRLENVTFSYDRAPVLKGVSMELPAGQITTLIGGSGAGKTTIADLILALFEPNQGKITLDGVALTHVDIGRWRSMVGYVPQEVLLFNDTILANVTLGDPAISESAVIEALEMAGAMRFVAELPDGLYSIVGDLGALLSGGQRQRIALARALVTKPTLLIFDEATSALDPETEAAICAAVARQRGRLTVLAITHQPAWIELADRVYRIENCKVSLVYPEPARDQTALPSTGAIVTFPARIS
jgi:ATP-binding cassette, subfamily C, bacterial